MQRGPVVAIAGCLIMAACTRAPAPTPTIEGRDKAALHASLQSHRQAAVECVRRAEAHGQVAVLFDITEAGTVTNTEVSGETHEAMEAGECLRSIIAQTQFPKAGRNASTRFKQVFHLMPGPMAAPPPPPPSAQALNQARAREVAEAERIELIGPPPPVPPAH
jgi:hypothetical protein